MMVLNEDYMAYEVFQENTRAIIFAKNIKKAAELFILATGEEPMLIQRKGGGFKWILIKE